MRLCYPEDLVSYLIVILGVLICICSLCYAIFRHFRFERSEIYFGEVTRLEYKSEGESMMFYPEIKFTDFEGNAVSFLSNRGSASNRWPVGGLLPVMIVNGRPEIHDASLMLEGCGAAALIGLGMIASKVVC